ncbi:acyl-CoA dehydrogenase family protein [Gordonia polyisoprenivorans]|uniref:acyl-CoA dehydrogenase family protein n=1 Tax=Gordonia polyisoprenivorans TaxID=84595 RepID=UPI001AD77320|nr:acyl-CoA dehydrogenase family protein [Gordonia polyisoprenivorans]QTI69928.1 acyl-CoA dehydrogenase family protein [Gordonia polyisoprenivorans]
MTTSIEDRQALVSLVRDFAQREVAPRVREYDLAEQLPRDILDNMGRLGLMGGTVPEEWGGAGLDHVTYTAIIEEISRVDHCLGVIMSMPSALVGCGLQMFGTDDQKKQWLTPLARGEMFGGAGVTEPQSGSDVAGMQTTYKRDGDDFIINGAKTWISNLDLASFFVTFASSDTSKRHGGITAFVIPKDTPGLSVHPFKNKLGFRPICSGELVLDNVRVGPEALLGEEGHGFDVAMTAVERGRLGVAARSVGAAQLCLDASVEYANERSVGGNPIGTYQQIQQKIADMATGIQAARLLVEDCARTLDSGDRGRVQTSMAKMYAADVFQRVATEAVQIHGAYGVSDEFPVARAYRDSKVFQIVEGTNEIHHVLIAREMLSGRGARK